jgi:L-serine/L-threonine ammonia-lyase
MQIHAGMCNNYRMKPLHIETPLTRSSAITIHAGRDVWLKLEAVQPTGSFKIRGIGLACQEFLRQGARRFISSSGGNAGIAVAYAGRHLSLPVVVAVPETTTERAKALIQQEGAQVIVYGSSWQEANALAQGMVKETDAFLHPFDHPLLWQGHATMLDEVVRSGLKPDVVILSVGGGGLLCGVVDGLRRNGWTDVPVIAVETEGAASFAHSIAAGNRVELPAITSVATSLGARQVCEQACTRFLADHRILVEPACGASLSVVYDGLSELEQFKSILVIVCGGATTTVEQLQQWSRQLN